MDVRNIADDFNQKVRAIHRYVKDDFPRMAMRKSLRFIDGNFRAQGWQGRGFLRWIANQQKTTILTKSGALRRSIQGTSAEWETRIWTDSPYSRVHNRGFKGQVTVKAHTRTIYAATIRQTHRYNANGEPKTTTIHWVDGTQQVKSHIRNMNIPQRQFMPEDINDSPVLFNAIRRDLTTELKRIFE